MKDIMEEEKIYIEKVDTKENVTDMLTKTCLHKGTSVAWTWWMFACGKSLWGKLVGRI